MFDFTNLLTTLEELLRPQVLIPWLLGMTFGVFVGATPGLTATMAVALVVPFSFYLDPQAGLALIIGVSFTAIFAGDIPATYLRIPGTPASAAATLDGYELAKQGKGRLSLLIDLFCSTGGGLVGVGMLIFAAPQLAKFALQFSFAEYFWLAVLGLSVSALVSRGGLWKGLLAAALGMLICTAGYDPLEPIRRFTFGSEELYEGFHPIVVMIGLFGMSEVLRSAASLGRRSDRAPEEKQPQGSGGGSAIEALIEIWRRKWTALRCSVVGVVIGALPGAGADIAAWAAYGLEHRISRQRKKFGGGAVEGVIAPTSANNAAVAGAWMPALVFGVPGDAVTAIVLGALMMYDITPGPMVFQENGDKVQSIFVIALLTQLLLLPAGYLGIRGFGALMRLPKSIILAAVVLFSMVGAYALQNSLFDVYVMLGFGVLGYVLEKCGIPLAPLILGLILGRIVEENLRNGLTSFDGDWTPFFTRPLCVVMWVSLLLALLAGPAARWMRKGISP